MPCKHCRNSFADLSQASSNARPEPPIRHLGILEEATCGSHIQLAVCPASVDEERDGEHGLGIGREVARGYETKLRVCGNGLLDALEAEFASDGEIVESGAELIACCDKL